MILVNSSKLITYRMHTPLGFLSSTSNTCHTSHTCITNGQTDSQIDIHTHEHNTHAYPYALQIVPKIECGLFTKSCQNI